MFDKLKIFCIFLLISLNILQFVKLKEVEKNNVKLKLEKSLKTIKIQNINKLLEDKCKIEEKIFHSNFNKQKKLNAQIEQIKMKQNLGIIKDGNLIKRLNCEIMNFNNLKICK